MKRGKNDAVDAEAICEAMSRPSMRFVPVKSAEQQAALTLIGARDLLMRQRTALINAIRGHAAEFGITVAKGPGKLPELLARVAAEGKVPALACEMLSLLAGQLAGLDARLKQIELELLAWHKRDARSRLLATIPGVGPIGAVTVTLKVPDARVFRSGRHFAAWLGLTPRENSTGGKQRLGKMSREGDEGLRRLLVLGATAVINYAEPGKSSPWLLDLLARRPRKIAAVALANKMARIMWAMLVSGEAYRRPKAA